MHALIGDIEHRRAINGDSDFDEIMSDEASDQPRRGLSPGRLETRLDRARSGVRAPIRRPHSLDPATLLIDQHRRVSATDAFPERPRQFAHLLAVGDIALEENQTPRVFPTQEGPFLGIEREAGAAADEGLRHYGSALGREKAGRLAHLAMKHWPPSPFKRAQSAAASAFVRPTTRKR